MSRAFVDGMRYRVDVFTNDWEAVISKVKATPTNRRMLVDAPVANVDGVRHRVDVLTDVFEKVINASKR